jgi:hypothetical protein
LTAKRMGAKAGWAREAAQESCGKAEDGSG